MTNPINSGLDWLNKWFSIQKNESLKEEWKALQKHPTVETIDLFHHQLVKGKHMDEDEIEIFDVHWNGFRSIITWSTNSGLSRIPQGIPKVLFDTGSSTSKLMAPAPADPKDLPFRSEEVEILLSLFKDHNIAILTGYPSIDVEYYVLKELRQRDEFKIYVQEWDSSFLKDDLLADIVRHKYVLRDQNGKDRLIIVVGNPSGKSNLLVASEVKPFIQKLFDWRKYSVPAMGLIPKLLNIPQAVRHVFGQETQLRFEIGRLIENYLPLTTPFLNMAREAIHHNVLDVSTEDLIKRIAKTLGIEKVSAQVIVDSGFYDTSPLPNTSYEELQRAGKIIEPPKGYELFMLRDSISSYSGSAGMPGGGGPNLGGKSPASMSPVSMSNLSARFFISNKPFIRGFNARFLSTRVCCHL